jgi:hypothetical protein
MSGSDQLLHRYGIVWADRLFVIGMAQTISWGRVYIFEDVELHSHFNTFDGFTIHIYTWNCYLVSRWGFRFARPQKVYLCPNCRSLIRANPTKTPTPSYNTPRSDCVLDIDERFNRLLCILYPMKYHCKGTRIIFRCHFVSELDYLSRLSFGFNVNRFTWNGSHPSHQFLPAYNTYH